MRPSFVYGGDAFNVAPPRVPSGYGKLVDGVLSSGPLRVASGIGGPIGLALTPPCSVEDLAGAVVTGALGGKRGIIDGTDAIKASLVQ